MCSSLVLDSKDYEDYGKPATRYGGGLVASGRAYQLRVPSLSLGMCWPLFFANTNEWPKITHMLP